MHRSHPLPAGLFALTLAALAAYGAPARADQPARGELKVTAVEGAATVSVAGAGGGVSQGVKVDAVLHEGDVIETGPDGRVELLVATGTRLRIGASARAELREAPAGGGRFRLKLAAGNFWAHVAKLLTGDRFEIETENGVAGVRGTEFSVDAATGGGDDLLRVYEGAVQCDHIAGKWSKRLEPGTELLFHRDRPTTLRGFDVAARTPLRDWRQGPRDGAKDGAKDGQGSGEEKDAKKRGPKDGKKEKKGPKVKAKGPKRD
jgi:ferric-dicitrate binding protein FerR (iron transport regulator)